MAIVSFIKDQSAWNDLITWALKQNFGYTNIQRDGKRAEINLVKSGMTSFTRADLRPAQMVLTAHYAAKQDSVALKKQLDGILAKLGDGEGITAEGLIVRALAAQSIWKIPNREIRAEGARLFKELTGHTCSVWAMLPEYFPEIHTTQFTVDGVRALSYLCQLKRSTARILYTTHADHFNEPNINVLILQEVNTEKGRRRGNKQPSKAEAQLAQIKQVLDDGGVDVLNSDLVERVQHAVNIKERLIEEKSIVEFQRGNYEYPATAAGG